MPRAHIVYGVAIFLASASLAWADLDGPPRHHQITTSSRRAERSYRSGLEALHLGDASRAAAEFRGAVRRDPDCAMGHWGLSRALLRQANLPEARAAAERAGVLASRCDDREQQLIAAWRHYLASPAAGATPPAAVPEGVLDELDRIIALYPADPEGWVLRGQLSESELRAAPFILGALQQEPGHPIGKVWNLKPLPLPRIQPAATQPVSPLPSAPKLFDGLGMLDHAVSSSNTEARAYYLQGLRCFHSYVAPGNVANGAGQSFRHAATLDPQFAMAYWGLSFCPTRNLKPIDLAHRALSLALAHASDREQRFCAARVLEVEAGDLAQEAGRIRADSEKPGAMKETLIADAKRIEENQRSKRRAFLDALDSAIVAYPTEVELWTWRGKVFASYGGGPKPGPSIPYQLAAHFLAPAHPSPNHEMVHAYEGIERPALGWKYTEGYRQSARNMPHANHMQAHLAMRLGRWTDAIDCTRRSQQTRREGFPELDPTHHVDVLIRALAHEGRFAEAGAEPRAYKNGLPWARLLQLKCDTEGLREWAERRQGSEAPDGDYIGAVVALNAGDLAAAEPLVSKVEAQFKRSPANLYRYHEVRGRFLVQSGQADAGLKLLREAAAKAVKDTGLHAWGGGSYVLEVWGEAALRAQRWDDAEEAFHEALAHEHNSVVGALGMQVTWERRGRGEMASHYAARAAAIWKGADPGALDRQLQRLRKIAGSASTP